MAVMGGVFRAVDIGVTGLAASRVGTAAPTTLARAGSLAYRVDSRLHSSGVVAVSTEEQVTGWAHRLQTRLYGGTVRECPAHNYCQWR